jgi:thiamine transporter
MEILLNNIGKIVEQPSVCFTILAVLLIILGLNYISKVKINLRTMVFIALMLAISFILRQFKLWHMPQGGSVTCGAMLPLLLISYRYGSGVGVLSGFVYGMFNILQDPFLVHPLQVLFDYPLPFMALGIAGYKPTHRYFWTGLAFLGRFLCHFISGAVFFASYAPAGMSPYWYSLVFNATYLIPEFFICFILLKILPIDRFLARMHD